MRKYEHIKIMCTFAGESFMKPVTDKRKRYEKDVDDTADALCPERDGTGCL